MIKLKIHYQPAPVLAVIDWSWTLLILVFSIIFWLEVTHFQWITLLFMVLFFIISGFEILGRLIMVTPNQLVVRDLFFFKLRTFDLAADRPFKINGHQLILRRHRKLYAYLVTGTSAQRLKRALTRR